MSRSFSRDIKDKDETDDDDDDNDKEEEALPVSVRKFRENLSRSLTRDSNRQSRALSPLNNRNSPMKRFVLKTRQRRIHLPEDKNQQDIRLRQALQALPSSLLDSDDDDDDTITTITTIASKLEQLRSHRIQRRQKYSKYYDDEDDGHKYDLPETDDHQFKSNDQHQLHFGFTEVLWHRQQEQRIPSFVRP